MRTFIGTVKLFNGRYWRESPVRVEASNLSVAIARAVKKAPKRKRERIEGISVTLEPVKGFTMRPPIETEPEESSSPSTGVST